jgi:benzil reductase ((S)-benzoin forming)
MKSEKKDLYIITGGSKGLGCAIAENALAKNQCVITISRTENKKMQPKNINNNLMQIKHDLSVTFSETEKMLNYIFKKINFKNCRHIYFVNNAAQIQPVSEIGKLNSIEIQKHIYLNYTVPVLLTNWLMSKKTNQSGYKVITQISSGAASFAITNWSIYCSSKAAIEMFNSVMQIQLQKNKKVKAITYAPGIIDTGMQAVIRGLKKSDFPEVARFKNYKKTNELRTAAEVANHLMNLLSKPEKLSQKSYSI